MRRGQVLCSAVLAIVVAVPAIASARTVVMVHGRNSGTSNVTDYWKIGTTADGVKAFTGTNTHANYTYTYDATQSWSDLSANTRPVCALTAALNSAPGTDLVPVAHSAGGLASVYLLSVAQNGWAHSCATAPATAKTWMTYVITVASPFRGTEIANAVYGHTGGDFMHALCGNIVGGIANLISDQATPMTWALQTTYMATNFASLTAYGTYATIYTQGGTGRGGDDSTALGFAQSCSGLESSNDGFVTANSAAGCARGTAVGTNCMPYGTRSYYASVGHSSNRRNNYGTFAAYVWARNPY